MPTGLAVPTEFGSIIDAVVAAITRLSEAARYGLNDTVYEGELSNAEREGRKPPGG